MTFSSWWLKGVGKHMRLKYLALRFLPHSTISAQWGLPVSRQKFPIKLRHFIKYSGDLLAMPLLLKNTGFKSQWSNSIFLQNEVFFFKEKLKLGCCSAGSSCHYAYIIIMVFILSCLSSKKMRLVHMSLPFYPHIHLWGRLGWERTTRVTQWALWQSQSTGNLLTPVLYLLSIWLQCECCCFLLLCKQ